MVRKKKKKNGKMVQAQGYCKVSGVSSTSECPEGRCGVLHGKGTLAQVPFSEEVDQIHNPRLKESGMVKPQNYGILNPSPRWGGLGRLEEPYKTGI